jgi:hypothetical protein
MTPCKNGFAAAGVAPGPPAVATVSARDGLKRFLAAIEP